MWGQAAVLQSNTRGIHETLAWVFAHLDQYAAAGGNPPASSHANPHHVLEGAAPTPGPCRPTTPTQGPAAAQADRTGVLASPASRDGLFLSRVGLLLNTLLK